MFQITHPFHPRSGQEHEVIEVRNNWGEDRVYYHDSDARLKSLPTAWTSLAPADPFLIAADGRSRFHIDGLLALARRIQELAEAAQ